MSTTGLRFSFKNAWDETLKLGTGVFHWAWNCVTVCTAFTGPPSWLCHLQPRFPPQGLEQPHFTTRFISCKGKPPTNWLHPHLKHALLLQSYSPRSHGRCRWASLFIWWRSSSLAEWASASAILAWASSCLRHSFSSMSWKDIWKTRGFNRFLEM